MLHSQLALLYRPVIYRVGDEIGKQMIAGYFEAVQYIPGDNYLGCQLRYYLTTFSAANVTHSLELHTAYAVAMKELPWDRFTPTVEDISEIYRILRTQNSRKDHTSLMQSMCAHVIAKTDWSDKAALFQDPQCLDMMFFVAIRVPYELPQQAMQVSLILFYESIQGLPWLKVSERNYEEALDWIVFSYPQLAFVPKLCGKEKTIEKGMLRLLLLGAAVYDPATQKPVKMKEAFWVDGKKRRLIAALVRLFVMGANCDKAGVQGSLKEFLDTMAFHYGE